MGINICAKSYYMSLDRHWRMGCSLQLLYANEEKKSLTQYGLSSLKRPPPVRDHLGLIFCVVAHGRFDCDLTKKPWKRLTRFMV